MDDICRSIGNKIRTGVTQQIRCLPPPGHTSCWNIRQFCGLHVAETISYDAADWARRLVLQDFQFLTLSTRCIPREYR
ncbi:hypothetical protein PhaeoP72_02335 [Phaeobacter inhibens]|nr:hypothetical protein PhaeoP92_02229 [Phaeobacter inhibens]AUQ78909.1 hypothetical protein PhaeoP74_02230 [Phaeobacter inhibens]AUR04294.1 hypothetical protein PhaeoP72_02335 [Phaeobacter inhibens]AUR16068.1 hypothetical protein PhaeoP70_02228 [Phaeobacter inhibens]